MYCYWILMSDITLTIFMTPLPGWGAALLYLSLMLESSLSTFRASLETTVHSLSIDYVVGRDNLPTCPPFQFQRQSVVVAPMICTCAEFGRLPTRPLLRVKRDGWGARWGRRAPDETRRRGPGDQSDVRGRGQHGVSLSGPPTASCGSGYYPRFCRRSSAFPRRDCAMRRCGTSWLSLHGGRDSQRPRTCFVTHIPDRFY